MHPPGIRTPVYLLTILTALVAFAPASISAQRKPFIDPGAEKELISAEMERYRSRILHSRNAPAADENYDVIYYRIAIRINTTPKMLYGNVTFKAKSMIGALSSIRIDLSDSLSVDSIVAGSTLLSYTRTSNMINVTLDRPYGMGEEFTFDVGYHGVPVSSGFGSFSFSTTGTSPWIWSLSQPYGARDWWPCKDGLKDKADSVDIVVTCDSSWLVGSNGSLASVVTNGDGTSTTTWKERYPIATYLVSIAISNYVQFSNWWHYSPTDSMQVLNYVRPDHLASALANLPRTVDMLDIFSEMFGMYPFVKEKYGHSDFGWGGAMEHQTMTSTGSYSENLIAHELAHQWFGDMITCRSWADLWLNEGFATYGAGLYLERMYGTSPFWNYMTSRLNDAKNATGTLYVQDTVDVGNLFRGSRVYNKGASVLHMLRHVLGDSLFFASMASYAGDTTLRYGTAVTADFRRACETVSGVDLSWFFDQWVFGEGYPSYSYGWSSQPSGGGFSTQLRIIQTASTSNPSVFRMPVDVRLAGAGWDTTVVIIDSMNTQDFTFDTPLEPTSVMIDSGRWLLRDLDSTSYIVLDVTASGSGLPPSSYLLENYPNPFNPATTIRYGLPYRSSVGLTVRSILGGEVEKLYFGTKEPGSYRVDWDASGRASGVYLIDLIAIPEGNPAKPPVRISRKILYLR